VNTRAATAICSSSTGATAASFAQLTDFKDSAGCCLTAPRFSRGRTVA
jgi:hypothetical protein